MEGTWICPQCETSNENTDKCIVCGMDYASAVIIYKKYSTEKIEKEKVIKKSPTETKKKSVDTSKIKHMVVTDNANIDIAMSDAMSMIEENGYDPSGFIGRIGVKNMLRKLRDANGAPAYVNGTTGGELYGQPIEFVRNGAWDNKRADIITGNFKYAVVGMRAGINYEILTEATLQGTLDSDGKPLSLAEQDMVAIKATMRLGFLVVKDDAFAAFKNGVPTLGELTVESVAGTTGNTVITVSPKPIGGHKLVYKTAASTAPSVAYDDDLSKWTEFNNGDEITATNGHKITVAEVTADGKARKSGSADVVSGE